MRSVRLIVSVLFILCMAYNGPAGAAQFLRSDNGQPVSAAAIDDVLTTGGIIAHLDAGERAAFYGFEIQAQQDSTVYVSVSSEFISAACLRGAFTAEGSRDIAAEGKVYVHAYGGNETNLYDFDIERFLGSSSFVVGPDIRAGLAEAMSKQGRKKFWGTLQVSNSNSQAPVAPHIEAVRRDYLLLPEIVKIRQEAHGDPEKMARLSAERFIEALSRRDRETTASLLHPALFSKGRTPDEWITLREAFAKDMAASTLAAKVRNAVVNDGSLEAGYVVSLKNGEQYQLNIEAMDAMTFVKSIRKM